MCDMYNAMDVSVLSLKTFLKFVKFIHPQVHVSTVSTLHIVCISIDRWDNWQTENISN